MKLVVARYRRWLQLPASEWSGRGVLILFGGLTGVLYVFGGVGGGLIADDFPRDGRFVGLVLAGYGALGLILVYRILRGRALIRELVVLAVWWVPSGWLDAWANESDRLWRWPVLPLVVLVWLLMDGRKDRPAHTGSSRTTEQALPHGRVTN